jgi:hypothetical protein
MIRFSVAVERVQVEESLRPGSTAAALDRGLRSVKRDDGSCDLGIGLEPRD